MEKTRGSITVFFTLLLTTILTLICGALESARYSALSFLMETAQGSALESVFAGYYRPLWEEYHLLFMADSAGFTDAMREILEIYGDPEMGSTGHGNNLFPFTVKEITVTEAETAVQDGAAAFRAEILRDMKVHGTEVLAEKLLGQKELVTDAGVVSEYVRGLSGLGDMAEGLEEEYTAISKAGNNLREVWRQYEEGAGNAGMSEAESEAVTETVQEQARLAKQQAEEVGEQVRKKTEVFTEVLSGEQENLKTRQGQVGEAAYGIMEEELNNLKAYEEGGERQTEQEGIRQKLLQAADAMESLETELLQQDDPEAVKIRTLLEEIPEQNVQEKQESPLLQAAENWQETGMLALILPEGTKVSEARLKTETRVSGLEGAGGMGALDKVITTLYMSDHFGNFLEPGETVLAYELEYILAGKDSDRENIEQAAKKLIALRTGMNMLYLLRDTGKRAEAEAMAAALVGFTGILPLIRLTAALLLGAWALAEAVSDGRILFAGGQVPLVKTEQDWKLSLEQAPALLTGNSSSESEKTVDGSKGKSEMTLTWDYKTYLTLLCFLGDGEEGLSRSMNLMEMNLRAADSGFFLENCLSYAGVETIFEAKPMFFRLPLRTTYTYKAYAAYGYDEI